MGLKKAVDAPGCKHRPNPQTISRGGELSQHKATHDFDFQITLNTKFCSICHRLAVIPLPMCALHLDPLFWRASVDIGGSKMVPNNRNLKPTFVFDLYTQHMPILHRFGVVYSHRWTDGHCSHSNRWMALQRLKKRPSSRNDHRPCRRGLFRKSRLCRAERSSGSLGMSSDLERAASKWTAGVRCCLDGTTSTSRKSAILETRLFENRVPKVTSEFFYSAIWSWFPVPDSNAACTHRRSSPQNTSNEIIQRDLSQALEHSTTIQGHFKKRERISFE